MNSNPKSMVFWKFQKLSFMISMVKAMSSCNFSSWVPWTHHWVEVFSCWISLISMEHQPIFDILHIETHEFQWRKQCPYFSLLTPMNPYVKAINFLRCKVFQVELHEFHCKPNCFFLKFQKLSSMTSILIPQVKLQELQCKTNGCAKASDTEFHEFHSETNGFV